MKSAKPHRARSLLSTVALLMLALPAHADGNFYLGVGLGGGDIDLSEDLSGTAFGTADSSGDSALAAEFSLGVQFDTGWLAELSVDDYETITFLIVDSVDYDAIRIGVGYAPQVASRFSIVAKAGIAFWDLTLRQSPLFNPGPELEVNSDGQDLYLQLGGEFHATARWRIGLSYDYADTDFGDVDAFKIYTRYLFGR